VLLNSYYSIIKKIRKVRMIFDVENWLWMSNFGTFLTPPHYTNLQNSLISSDYSWLLAKNLLILYPSPENSATGIAIVQAEVLRNELGILQSSIHNIFQRIFFFSITENNYSSINEFTKKNLKKGYYTPFKRKIGVKVIDVHQKPSNLPIQKISIFIQWMNFFRF
jgi:hypothetical protein